MTHLFGNLLVESGVITPEQLKTALARQRNYGGKLASNCLNLAFADERSLAVVLSRHMGVPHVVLSCSAISVRMAEEVPYPAANKLGALPVKRDGDMLYVAMANPQDISALDSLRFGTGARIVELGAISSSITIAIQNLHELHERKEGPFLVGADADPRQIHPQHGYVEIVRGSEPIRNQPSLSLPEVDESDALQLTDWSGQDIPTGTALPLDADRQRRVLVVDDEPELRDILSQFLKREGFAVSTASDGNQAMRMLAQELPDILLLDAMLPGVHGFDICKQVKSSPATRHICVVMVSAIYRGWRYEQDIRRMYGADAFLEKPFRFEKLRATLNDGPCGRGGGAPVAMDESAREMMDQAARAFREGDTEKAVFYLNRAIEAAPFVAELYQRLSLLQEQLGQTHRALAALERATELDPSYANLVALARRLEGEGFVHKAFEAWERCFWLCQDRTEAEKIREHMSKLLPRG